MRLIFAGTPEFAQAAMAAFRAEQAAARRRNDVLIGFEPERHRDSSKAPQGGADVPVGAHGVDDGLRIRTALGVQRGEHAVHLSGEA